MVRSKQNLGIMKAYENHNNKFTCAQIEPLENSTPLFRSFSKQISISFALMIMFFLTTSYVSEENAAFDLRREFYLAAMHRQLSSGIKANSCILLNENVAVKTNRFIEEFYSNNGFRPAWTINYSLNSAASEMLGLFNRATFYGLDKRFYHIEELRRLTEKMNKTMQTDSLLLIRCELELLLTGACFSFMTDISMGMGLPDSCMTDKVINELSNCLNAGINNRNLKQKVLELQPSDINYKNLQKALERYINSGAFSDGAIDIPDPNKSHEVSYAHARLVLEQQGYLSKNELDNDSLFIQAVKEFQKFHGLNQDGILNVETRQAMSMSGINRFLKIALNLDRLRKDINQTGECVFVNIPAYQLRVFRANRVMKTFNVVVGRPSTPTPELTSKIEKIVTIPEWNVPKSISLNEILPRVKTDSSFLIRNNFKVIDKQLNEISLSKSEWQDVNRDNFDFYFVQNSGNSNALGLYKFSFNNSYRVYIHDTPTKRYFNKDIRAFSHGCIRLQDPDQFADYLIKNNMNSAEKPDINDLVTSRMHKEITLSIPIPIHIRYYTCEADENLNIYFYKDIYGKDDQQIQSLFN